MTTLKVSGAEEVVQRLREVYLRRRMVRLGSALAILTTAVLASLVVAGAAGYWPDQPPPALRWGLLGAACLAWALAAGWTVLTAVFWRQNPAQNARFVEQAMPAMRNDLINAVLLARDTMQSSPELVEQALHESTRRCRTAELEKSISLRPLKRWAVAAACAAAVLGAFALFQGRPLERGLLAVFRPSHYVPAINAIRLLGISPGDATVFAGQEVAIVARVDNPTAGPLKAQVVVAGAPAERAMLASDRNAVFTCPLGKVEQTIRYSVQIGDSRWPTDKPYYSLQVLSRVEVEGVDVEYTYPAYTGLDKKTVPNAPGPVEAPQGTQVKLTLRLSAPVPAAAMDIEGASPLPMRAQAATDKAFTASLMVDKDAAYRLLIQDAQGRTIQQCPDLGNGQDPPDALAAANGKARGYWPIHAIADPPPKVEFLAPNRDVTASPGEKVALRVKATDKYGLTQVRLIGHPEKAEDQARDLMPPVEYKERNKQEAVIDFQCDIPANAPDDGSWVIVYHAQAADNRDLEGAGGSQTSVSRQFKITVQNAARLAEEKARRLEELRKRLMDILKMQQTHRLTNEICWKKHQKLDEIVASGGQVHAGQRTIRADLLDLVDNFPFDAPMAPVQTALALLANNEAQLAIDQSQVLSALADMMQRDRVCIALAGTQDRIIDTLQTLLALLPSLADQPGQKKDDAAGQDIPPEAREKLKALKDNLDKFIDEQRKIIAASDRLAKKPVDDFTNEDNKILQDLQALEDKWDKFLNEAFADFSKLAQQDFSNPAMLKELLAVKNDVTMAKDALSQKAAEIATALEDNGVENAKELTANLEKWLPDTPDRTKWAMEDPAGGQENIEAPELPKELEDLVGDLLEQEEDLFDEMEDLSSKYTMSGDKGIGWDAMDGPISSMNAQGVTGNQLPNSNEMSGRSGEGRQGKSSGEFVADEAYGKGGRRTPTRLTPEPFQKGEVNDKSTEPAGGATGGGKISGAGEEGLEGPLPPPITKEMPRLAQKQAVLTNRAERIQTQFKNADYANFKLLEAITLMDKLGNDLAANRYQNALRSRKDVTGALRQSKFLLAGKVDVAADNSSGMPKYVRDNIADAMKGKLPAEFQGVVEQYYRRLGEMEPQQPGK